MNSMELSNYLEKIRYGRKMTQETFVEGIVSLRQYQRYRYGECEIPYEKLEQFASKLGIPTKKLLNEFEQEKNNQTKLLNDFYNAVTNRDVKTIQHLEPLIQVEFIIEDEKKLFYKHAIILWRLFTKKISKIEAIRENSVLINFPNILKHQYFTDIEVLVLSSLLDLLDVNEQEKLLDKLTNLFSEQESIMTAGNEMIYSVLLVRLIKAHAWHKNYTKIIELCDSGINRGFELKQYYLLENFFYYKSLAHFYLEQYIKYEESLFRCYCVLQMEGNRIKIQKFTEWIEKDFNIVFHTFIMKYLKKQIM